VRQRKESVTGPTRVVFRLLLCPPPMGPLWAASTSSELVMVWGIQGWSPEVVQTRSGRSRACTRVTGREIENVMARVPTPVTFPAPIVTVLTPDCAGTPEISPVVAFRESPAGNAPAVTVYVVGLLVAVI
jgi:hypothetical protein